NRVESNQPYLDRLPDLLRTLAQGDLPPGYELSGEVPGSHPACEASPAFEVSFEGGQYAVGARLEVFIGVVENTGTTVTEFQEVWCGTSEVVAVALWPSVVLQPGELTEIYIVRRLVFPEEQGRDRPSLLLTAQ
ncbi:MAG: type-F conjugative transfer system secretin TraK, partial [Nitrospirota bacterium]|nr:type-F conjugative transfer system secretin TraK [Nitrospirota bacterium]